MTSISIREGRGDDASAAARIDMESWRSTYRGLVPDAVLDQLDAADTEPRMRMRLESIAAGTAPALACGFVAEDERGTVVGYVFAGPCRPMRSGDLPEGFDSEIYALYLAPGYEGRGIGSRLVHAAAERLREAGARSVIIWALAGNPNRGFYEALGGVMVYEQDITIGDKDLREVGFGWREIDALIARSARR
ncbi:MAG TPA: GNAT family N-acetyltransferase [Ktedonobacterales bacterium]